MKRYEIRFFKIEQGCSWGHRAAERVAKAVRDGVMLLVVGV
jgi:hypothetical protein